MSLSCLISDIFIALTFCVKFIATGNMFSFKIGYRKIPKISPGLIFFKGLFRILNCKWNSDFCFSGRSYFNKKTAGGQLISVKMKMLLRTSRVTTNSVVLRLWFYKNILRGAGTKSEVFTFEIAPHSGNLLHLEGGPSLMLRYSPVMGVRGFPLTSA